TLMQQTSRPRRLRAQRRRRQLRTLAGRIVVVRQQRPVNLSRHSTAQQRRYISDNAHVHQDPRQRLPNGSVDLTHYIDEPATHIEADNTRHSFNAMNCVILRSSYLQVCSPLVPRGGDSWDGASWQSPTQSGVRNPAGRDPLKGCAGPLADLIEEE